MKSSISDKRTFYFYELFQFLIDSEYYQFRRSSKQSSFIIYERMYEMLVLSLFIATLCTLGCQGKVFSPTAELKIKALIAEKVEGTNPDCHSENGTCPEKKLAKREAATGKPCDCGAHSVGCTYVKDKKICTCEYGYGQAPNGTCIKPCGCKNNMYCEQNVCNCRRNGDLSGEHCEIVQGCEGWRGPYACGDPLKVTCGLDFRTGKKCYCNDPDLFYDTRERICGECDCGPKGECSLTEDGEKKCKCEDDYVMAEKGAYLEGECRRCDCGPDTGIFDKCKFNSSGKFCNCKDGFAQRAGKCIRCSCGDPHATCSFDGYKKVCTCNKGRVMQNGECVVCDCGPHCSCYYENGEKISKCNPDAIPFEDKCVECNCGRDGKCVLDSEGKKTCTCDKGFGEREGYCIDCQCYLGEQTVDCSFANKTQICHCPSGYKAVDFFCLPEDNTN